MKSDRSKVAPIVGLNVLGDACFPLLNEINIKLQKTVNLDHGRIGRHVVLHVVEMELEPDREIKFHL